MTVLSTPIAPKVAGRRMRRVVAAACGRSITTRELRETPRLDHVVRVPSGRTEKRLAFSSGRAEQS